MIGDYERPRVRLPGGGGAHEIASSFGQVYIVMQHVPRVLVPRVDFVTSFGHGDGGDHRQRLGLQTLGPTLVVTDMCLLRPDPASKELTVVSVHEGVEQVQVRARTGWDVRFDARLERMTPPTNHELEVLRELRERTARAHRRPTGVIGIGRPAR